MTLLAALAVGWGPADPAAACRCADQTTARHYARADVVFAGRLVERTVEEPVTSSTDPARHVFAVERAWKGQIAQRATVLSAVSGASCGLELQGAGPFVVFAGDAGPHLDAGLCDGTTPLTPTIEAELDDLAGPASPAVAPRSDPEVVGRWAPPVLVAGALAGILLLVVLRRGRS